MERIWNQTLERSVVMNDPSFPDLKKFFHPRSMAIIGASTDPNRIGGKPLNYSFRHGYNPEVLKIYPVNPKVQEILGLKCYPDVLQIPDEVDLALIALPANNVMDAVEQCVGKKIPFGIIFSSGFGELGDEGKKLELEVVRKASTGGMRLCGPNCQGMINLQDRIFGSFTPSLDIEKITPGKIGFVSQSGAFAGSIFNFAQQRRIGLSYWVSIGNQSDLLVLDCFMEMLNDERTKVLGAYVEGFKDSQKLKWVSDAALEKGKPLIILKGGRSQRGAQAALSHTGTIAGSIDVGNAAFRQYGLISVDGVEECFDIATLFADIGFAPGGGIGILTTSGAAGVLLTDRCEFYGLRLAELGEETKRKLRKSLPSFGSAENPVDLTAQMINNPSIFTDSLEVFMSDENVGLVLIMFTMVTGELAQMCSDFLRKVVKETNKPVVVCWMATKLSDQYIGEVQQAGIPIYETPYRCIRAVNALIKYSERLKKAKAQKIISLPSVNPAAMTEIEGILNMAIQKKKNRLTEYEGKEILKLYGIPVTRSILCQRKEEAIRAANEIGFPVVAKIESPDILHRTDAGAVKLNIRDRENLAKAYGDILDNCKKYKPDAEIIGVSISEMIPPGKEVIVGTSFDSEFGPYVMVGLGGVWVEVLKDVSFRMIPLSETDAEEMVQEIKGWKILKGIRGEPPSDIEALVKTLIRVSKLMERFCDRIAECEINPLLVYPKGGGVKALDCMVKLR